MKRANTPITSEQAVSVVVGALLMVSIMMIAAVQYQNNVIPAQEEATEIEHNREVRSQLHHLQSNVIATASSGQLRTTPIDVGTQFEQQFIFGFLPAVQSPNPQGTIETYNVSEERAGNAGNITITGADGRSGANNYWQASNTYQYTTSFLNYSIDYAQYSQSPTTRYENTILYDKVETSTGTNYAIQSNQNIVDEKNINLVTLTGDIDSTTTSTLNIQTRPVSAPSQTIVVNSPPESEGGPLTITIPTELPQSEWCSLPACGGGDGAGLLNDEMNVPGNNGYIQSLDKAPNGSLELEFVADETFTLQMSRVHLQSQQDQSIAPNTEAKYVAWQGSNRITFRENTRHTISAQVRDKYNNPVPGVDTVAASKDANNNDECVGDFVSGNQSNSLCPDNNRQPGERTSGENGEVTYFYDTPTVDDDTSINLQIELAETSNYTSFTPPNFAMSPDGSYASQSVNKSTLFDLDGESNIDSDGDGEQESTFRVLETKLNASQVVKGKSLRMSVLLDNTGLEIEKANFDPDVINTEDGSTATSTRVTPAAPNDTIPVQPGEQIRYSYTIHFTETGTYNISLAGTDITKQVQVLEPSSTIYDGTIQSAVENQSIAKVITSYKDEVTQTSHPAYNPSIPPVVQTSNGSFQNSAQGLIYDFGNAQTPDDKSLTLEGTNGALNVGTAFENVPQQQHYLLQLNYEITGNTPVEMMVVTRNGEVIDENTEYLLNPDKPRNTKYFTLSEKETEYAQNHKNIYLVYSADGEPVVDIYYKQAISSTDLLSISAGNTQVTDLQTYKESDSGSLEPAKTFTEYEPITISISKKNIGTSTVERTILLDENGQTIDSKTVTINPGETKTVTFVKYRPEGRYTFESESSAPKTITVGDPSGDGNRAPYAQIDTDIPTINNRYVPTGNVVGDDATKDFTLDGSESVDPNGDSLTYTWEVTNQDTGSSFTETGSTLTESQFTTEGNYSISLIVSDGNGGEDRIDRTLTINAIPPTALYTVNPHPIPEGTTTTFNALIAQDADGNIQTYTWSINGNQQKNSSNPYFENTFTNTGYHTVTLKTTDDDGNTKIQQQQVEVFSSSLTAGYTYTPSNPSTEDTVTFNAEPSQTTDGEITSYEWTDGTGELLGTGKEYTHTFNRQEDISVTLEITNSNGQTATTTKIIPISAPFTADIYTDQSSGSPGITFALNAYNSSDPNSLIEEYEWSMDDGTTYIGPQQYHEYSSAGSYEVTLTARGNGYESTDTVILDVESDAPIAIANFNATINLADSITIYGENSYHPSGSIATYNWNLGNGISQTGMNIVEYRYTEPTFNLNDERLREPYNATLTVSDQDGETDTDYVEIEVQNRGPYNDYQVDTNGDKRDDSTSSNYSEWVSTELTFNGTPSYHKEEPVGQIDTYKWTFTRPDGTKYTQHGEQVTENFSQLGEYTIEYDIKDQYGYWNNTTFTMDIDARDPKASFTYSPQEPGPSEPVTYDASTSAHDETQGQIQSYEWNFGDNSGNKTGEQVTHTFAGNQGTTYTATLTVTDQWGQTSTVSKNIITDPYQSCHEILINRQNAESGTYPIDPDDDGKGTIEVECNMDYDGGGWTVIDKQTMWDISSDTSRWFTTNGDISGERGDGWDAGPNEVWSVDDGGDHSFVYNINTGFIYQEMRVVDYKLGASSYRTGGSTSEMRGDNIALEDWNGLNSGGVSGDGGFGTANSVLDSYSNAFEGSHMCDAGPNQNWPSCGNYNGDGGSPETPPTDAPYFWDNGDTYQLEANTLAVGWGESGGQEEGWEWEDGEFWVRQPVGTFIYFYDTGDNIKNFDKTQAQNGHVQFQNNQVELHTDDGMTTIQNGDNIDLSRYNKIYVDYILTKDGGSSGSVQLTVDGTTKQDSITENYLVNDGSLEIDTSQMSGSGTVEVSAVSNGGANTTIEVQRVWGREGGAEETTTIHQSNFNDGTNGWTADSGTLTTKIGWLKTQCSSSQTDRVTQTFSPSLDANTITYNIKLAAVDSWDGETLKFQIRDSSGWRTLETATPDYRNTENDNAIYDCRGSQYGGVEYTWSDTVSVDGSITDSRVVVGTNQFNSDESIAIDYLIIERNT